MQYIHSRTAHMNEQFPSTNTQKITTTSSSPNSVLHLFHHGFEGVAEAAGHGRYFFFVRHHCASFAFVYEQRINEISAWAVVVEVRRLVKDKLYFQR